MSVYLSWLAVVGRPRQTPVGASAGRSKPLSIGRVGWKIGCLGAAVRRLLSIAIYIYSWSAANDPLQSAKSIVFSNCNWQSLQTATGKVCKTMAATKVVKAESNRACHG